ncbi:MAG: tRNA uridine-5-carboxymethylaminomethyl(34) synthesis GTPase MnmE [Clostridium sp.]|jgi:tRNA modification GTPase
MIHTDTIAAIATAMGNSGIGIVRISGGEAVAVADRIFKEKGKKETLGEAPSHTIHYGYIYDGDQVVDEVLVMLMRGPKSFTAEDTVEIDCHGGMLVTRRILETVLKAGARLAEPGEFTKRAFLNGRIDLSQAEAVIDVINAKNEYALKSSVGQLRGSVSKKIRKLREKILYEIAFIESALDDPEHISLDGYGERLLAGAQAMERELSGLIRSSASGRVVSEGIRTVILGKPNAGKSSLMNVLVGEDRAIVTDIAGTTRDILEEHIYLQGISLNVVDTAGIRSTSDVVEKIGVERAMEAARDADLIIYVVDGSRELDENDLQIMELIRERKAVVLLNKSDLEPVVSLDEITEKSGHRVISISAKEETGIDQLEEEIKSLFYEGEIDFNDQVLITNVRHAEALREAYDSIRMVENSIENGMPEDFFSIDLMNAYEKLGLIVGEAVEDDLVNEIFSKFCMGK